MTLVELCAGSAACSLQWLQAGAEPPVGWPGSKRLYAPTLLQALGLRPGAGAAERVILVEPGPYGALWDGLRHPAIRSSVRSILTAWEAERARDIEGLWRQLRDRPVPEDEAARLAAWLVLQQWSYWNKPVLDQDGRWRTHGFNAAATRREQTQGCKSLTLGDLLASLARLPDLSRVTVLRHSAEQLQPFGDAVVLLDPDYQGTTSAYGHTLPRSRVLELAQAWAAAGALVTVCEQEPLPLPGWHHLELGAPVGHGRTASRQRREVVTLSRPPAGQLGLFGG